MNPEGLRAGDPAEPVGRRALWFAVFGAPAAWSAHFLVSVAVSSAACVLLPEPVTRQSRAWWTLMAFSAVALAVAGLGLWTGIRSLRAARSVADTGAHAARARFMALGGLILAGFFLVGLGFDVLPLFLMPICR